MDRLDWGDRTHAQCGQLLTLASDYLTGVITKTGSGRSVFLWYAANCPRLALVQIAKSRS